MTTVTSAPVADLPAQSVAAPATTPRLTSIDAFRGFVMFLMLAEAMRLWTLHAAFPDSRFWALVAYNTEHVPWQGCSLHDLIQPAFSFLVGAALPFSIAAGRRKGRPSAACSFTRSWRSVALILLGIFLRSLGRSRTYWTFEDTLTQIGLGYTFLFLLAFASLRVQVIAFVALLAGFWAAFALYPLPGPASITRGRRAGRLAAPLLRLSRALQQELESGVGVRHLVPQPVPAREAVPVQRRRLVDAELHPDAGDDDPRPVVRRVAEDARATTEKLKGLVIAGVALTLAGLALQWLHVNPIVKRIWTSSYTLYSGGLVILMLAAFYAVIEMKGWRRWAFPLLVIGANSIAVYVMSWTMEDSVKGALVRHSAPRRSHSSARRSSRC